MLTDAIEVSRLMTARNNSFVTNFASPMRKIATLKRASTTSPRRNDAGETGTLCDGMIGTIACERVCVWEWGAGKGCYARVIVNNLQVLDDIVIRVCQSADVGVIAHFS